MVVGWVGCLDAAILTAANETSGAALSISKRTAWTAADAGCGGVDSWVGIICHISSVGDDVTSGNGRGCEWGRAVFSPGESVLLPSNLVFKKALLISAETNR